MRAVVEEISPTRSDTKSADSQCNTRSSVYATKPENTDAAIHDDTQIVAARHMDVTLESKKWVFIGIVALIVLVAAGIVVLLVANSRNRRAANNHFDFA